MPTFRAAYIDANGDERTSRLTAANAAQLRTDLLSVGSHLTECKELTFDSANRSISRADLLLFIDLLATQLSAGVTTVTALDKIRLEPAFSRRAQHVLTSVHSHLAESRGTLARALAQHPKAFPKDLVQAVSIAEASGGNSLPERLRDTHSLLTFLGQLRTTIRNKAAYPVGVILCVIGLLIIVSQYLLPKLVYLFTGTQTRIPANVQTLIDCFHWIRYSLPYYSAGALLLAAVLYPLRKRSAVAMVLGRFILGTPIIGSIAGHAAVAAVCKNYRSQYLAGISHGTALRACAEATPNPAIGAALRRAAVLIEEGIIGRDRPLDPPVTAALSTTGFFPSLSLTILSTGEATGTFPDALQKVADIYHTKTKAEVEVAAGVFNAFMFTAISATVGFVSLAIYGAMDSAANAF